MAGSIAERKAEFIRLDAEIDMGHKMNVEKSIFAVKLATTIGCSGLRMTYPSGQSRLDRYIFIYENRARLSGALNLSWWDAYKMLPHKPRKPRGGMARTTDP